MKCTLACVMFLTYLAESGIPWPVGVSPDGQDSTWTIMNSYGNFHVGWDSLSKYHCNFHFGIDIPDFTDIFGPDTVRCVRDGTVTCVIQSPIPGSTQYQWALVICDSQSSSDGWSYHHMDSLLPYCQQLGDTLDKSWSISCMNSDMSIPHLHFMRSSYQYNPYNPGDGLLNPIDSLIPTASFSDGFSWEFNSAQDTLFFLSDMNYTDWPEYSVGCQDSVWKYQVMPNSLYGKVDLLYGYRLLGIGANANPLNLYPLCPQRIMWTLTSSESYTPLFNRYVADFSGAIGEAADSTKYKQFYFRWSYLHWLIPNLGNGLISCLTNCSDDTSGYNGIDNIQENSWATNLHSSGSGAAQLPEEAMYPDGAYQIEVNSYAWDSTEHTVTTDVVVDNFIPNIDSIIVYSFDFQPPITASAIFTECWTVEGGGRARDSVEMGYLDDVSSGLGIAVRFSEAVDQDSLSHFYFTGEIGGQTFYSSETEKMRWLFPIERIPIELGIADPSLWQCYETRPGVDCGIGALGCIGRLSFHVSDVQDLSGNTLDHDPSTIATPRDPETGVFNYSQVEDGPYDTCSWGVPTYSKIGSGIFRGLVLGTYFRVTPGINGSLLGNCPHWCGFWLERERSSINSPIYVDIVEPDGSYYTSTLFTGDSSSLSESALTPEPIAGRYGWFLWYTWRYEPVIITSPPDTIPRFKYYFHASVIDSWNPGSILYEEPLGVGESWPMYPATTMNLSSREAQEEISCSEENDRVPWYASGVCIIQGPLGDGSVYVQRSYSIYPDGGFIDTVLVELPSLFRDEIVSPEEAQQFDGVRIRSLQTDYAISPISPNPCRSNAAIKYSLAESGMVEISVYDLTGHHVALLVSCEMNPGNHTAVWDLRDSSGRRVPSGLYYVRLVSGGFEETRNLIVLRE